LVDDLSQRDVRGTPEEPEKFSSQVVRVGGNRRPTAGYGFWVLGH